MNTTTKRRIGNRWLGGILLLMTISSLHLEVTAGKYAWSVWVHLVLGIALAALSVHHIYLHYRFNNWFMRFARHRSTLVRVLWWIFLLTVVSGLAATVCWLGESGHTSLGGVHGKIGFLMAITAFCHVSRKLGKRNRR